MARLDDLDAAFHLPDTVGDQNLRNLYEVIVHRMREEAKDLPMNTVQQLLIERIANNYVFMRSRENGDNGGFATASAQKEYNNFWLSMTQEFNRMLGKAEALSVVDRKRLLQDIQQLIVQTVNGSVHDPKTRSDLLVNMATAFESVKM